MKTNSLLRSRPLALAAAALATGFLALASGQRAAAAPPAIFVDDGGTVPGFTSTGAAATGYTAPSGFQNPLGATYNPANNTLYVSDFDANKIRTFNATTGAETQIGFSAATGLNSPVGLAYGNGILYAANYNGSAVTAYNAATGARVTSGFTSPTSLSNPFGLAVTATTLYVANEGNANTLGAYNLATGAVRFTISGLQTPGGVALYGDDLFVANFDGTTVGEYNATTGAVINASFVSGLMDNPDGLAILGNRLLVSQGNGSTVGAYGIPATATNDNVPTSSDDDFLSGLNGPRFIAVVPEPGTWACLLVGVGALAARRGRRRERPGQA